jgi:hypothetical protein
VRQLTSQILTIGGRPKMAGKVLGINEGCSSKSKVSCEDRNKLNRTAYGGSSQATFVLYLVISLVAVGVVNVQRLAK